MQTPLKIKSLSFAEKRLVRFAREAPEGNNDAINDVARHSMDLLGEQMTPNKLNDFASRLVESSVFNAINFRSKLTGRLKHREEGMSVMNLASDIAKDGIDSIIDIGTDVASPYVAEVTARTGEQRATESVPILHNIAGEYGKNIGRTMGVEATDKAGDISKGVAGGVINTTVETGSQIVESGLNAVTSFLR